MEARHQCLIYEGSPSRILPALAQTINRKLDEGYRCLYLNSAPMVAGLRSYLASTGLDVTTEIANARLVLSSDPVSAGPEFDVERMILSLEDALEQALHSGYKGLWATGDMTWEFGREKNFTKLVQYEARLEDMFRRRPQLCGICQYHRESIPADALRQGLVAHPSVFINETISRINPYYARDNFSEILPSDQSLDDMIAELCRAGQGLS